MTRAPVLRCSRPRCPETRAPGSTFCPGHDRTSARNHGGVPRQLRGHGAEYERARRELAGEPCALRLPGCTGISTSADYTRPGDWTSPLQPACAHCQRVQGARLAAGAR